MLSDTDTARDVVTLTGTTAAPDGTVLRSDRTRLRFLDEATLDGFLAEAGFETEARYGDWHRGPVTAASREIITIARRPARPARGRRSARNLCATSSGVN